MDGTRQKSKVTPTYGRWRLQRDYGTDTKARDVKDEASMQLRRVESSSKPDCLRPRQQNAVCRFGIATCSGCGDPDNRPGFSPQAVGGSISPIILTLNSPAAHRQQLKTRFLDYDPPLPISLRSKYSQWLEPRSTAQSSAIDCLLLWAVVRSSGDEQLAHEASRLYFLAVKQLRKELLKPRASQDDSTLGAIDILSVCSRYHGRDEKPEDLESKHRKGWLAVVCARGPAALQSTFCRYLILNHLPEVLIEALLSRRCLIFGKKEWNTALRPFCNSTYSSLIFLACHLPASLENVESLLQSTRPSSSGDIVSMLNQLSLHDRALRIWLSSWYRSRPYSSLYWPVAMDTHFTDWQIGYPLGSAYMYHSVADALTHVSYWIILLEARQAICELADLPELDTMVVQHASSAADERRALQQECFDLADAICRTIPYLYSQSADTKVMAVVCSAMLYLRDFDGKSCKSREWCGHVLDWLKAQQANANFFKRHISVLQVLCGWIMFIE